MPDSLESVLQTSFGLEKFLPGQKEAIEQALRGRDVLLVMPTGGGKSLCYQLPAVATQGLALVISPLIALMKDQVDKLSSRGIPATFINSSISLEEQLRRIESVRNGHFRLVYVAPERFRSPTFVDMLLQTRLSLFAVDEAHCISQWGHDFRPDYLRLKHVIPQLGHPPTMALTATATPEVRQDIELQLGLRKPFVLVKGFDRPNLCFSLLEISSEDEKQEEVLRHIRKSRMSGIVYCSTIKRVDEVAEFLQANKVRAQPYHSKIDLAERRKCQESFMKGETPVIVATNAFGLGIDKPDIRFVIHFNIPGTVEAYYQEAGRAGRDGIFSDAILLFTYSDRYTQEFLIESNYPEREEIESVYAYLSSLEEDPILQTAETISRKMAGEVHEKKVYSCLGILERSGVLERLAGRHTLAWITVLKEFGAAVDREGTIRHRVIESILDWSAGAPGERIGLNLLNLAESAGLQEEQVRRTLSDLQREGVIHYQPPFRGRGVRLLRADLADLEGIVDFDSIDRRREHEMEKLETMLRFCRTESCRRAWILNYFGEKTSLKYCGNCDRCSERREEPEKATEQPPERPPERRESHVGERQELSEEELVVIQKTLSCVARMRGQYERSMVIAVLRGSEKQRLLDAGLDRLSTYGLLKGFQRKDLYQIFELLDIDDCIRTHLGSRCVSLTERGRKVMKREVLPGFHSLGLPGLVTPVPEKRKKPAAETEAYDEDLYRALRELRYGLATEQGLPAYMIFSDRTLREMSRRCPSTEAEMLAVQGVGPKIFRKYGHAFLSAIQNYVRLQGKRDEEDEAPEDAGVSEPDSGRYVVARTTEGHALTPSETQKQVLALIAEGWRLERIAEKLWMTLPAVIREVLAMSEKGVRIRVEEMLPSPRIEKIKAALPDQLDRVSLRALREKLPESVEAWEIQLVLLSERANRASTP